MKATGIDQEQGAGVCFPAKTQSASGVWLGIAAHNSIHYVYDISLLVTWVRDDLDDTALENERLTLRGTRLYQFSY